MTTHPVDLGSEHTAPTVVIEAIYKDAVTGALYVHQDLMKVQEPWAEEAHISPMRAHTSLGDVESFVAYVKRFGGASECAPFLTWNSRGFRAVLDYASDAEPGRCHWIAEMPFITSIQWQRWMALANGNAVSHKAAVEKLEDLGADILEPAQAELMTLLRSLRASVNAQADTELRPDGTASVSFKEDRNLKVAAGTVALPPTFRISIPILKGHVDEQGRPVVYALDVRVRVSIDSDAHLAFRFSIPDAEQALEDVYADRVKAASALLGEQFTLLRAAD